MRRRPARRLLLLLPLAACAAPTGADDMRLRRSGTDLTGEVGYAVTDAALRARVAADCEAAGLRFGSLTLGRIEGGTRAVRASCV